MAFDPLFTSLNAPIAITDSQSNTWVQVRYPWNNSSGVMWFCVNPSTSATHTFTLPNVENYGALFVRAYSGTATVNVLVQSSLNDGNYGTGITALSAGSLTPPASGYLFVSGVLMEEATSTCFCEQRLHNERLRARDQWFLCRWCIGRPRIRLKPPLVTLSSLDGRISGHRNDGHLCATNLRAGHQ